MKTPMLRIPAAGRTAEPATRTPAPAPPSQPLYGGSVAAALAWHLPKYLVEDAVATLDAEIEVPTWPGRLVFEVDFLIELGGLRPRRIAIEVGGSRALKDHVQERRRDARLVASGAVDVVYRVAGADVVGHVSDALYLIAAWEKRAGAGRYLPDPFTARGRTNLGQLAAPEARAVDLQADQPAAQIVYAQGMTSRRRLRRKRTATPHILVRRFDRRFPVAWQAYAAPAPRPVDSFVYHVNS